MTRLLSSLLVALFTLTATSATVNEIIVKSTTSQRVSGDMVRSNMALKPGGVFSQEQMTKDIKAIIGTNQFDDVVADVSNVPGDKVDVLLRITPKARVATIEFKGNDKISTRKLRDQVEHQESTPMDEQLLKADLKRIYELYRSKGYNDTVIKQDVRPNEDTGDITIIYNISETSRAKVRGVDFIGNVAFSDGELRKVISTDVSIWGYVFPAGYYNDLEFQNDLTILQQHYLNHGYLDFKVSKVDRQTSADGEKLYLTLHISEGEAYTISNVSINGNQAYGSEDLMALTVLHTGTGYKKRVERRDIDALSAHYNRDGYLDSRIVAERTPNREDLTVAVAYRVSEGNRTHIRNINISGNRITKDHVIRRELRIQPGDLSDSNRIAASKASLMNLGYFESVDIFPASTENPDMKDLNISVKEKLTGQFIFGAGVSSTDSILGTVEIGQSNFDLTNPWSFRGGGQRFRLKAQAGSTRQDFTLAFTEPWLFDRPLRLDTEFWSRETSSNREFEQKAVGTSIGITRKMSLPFWRQSVGYRIEDISINDIDNTFSSGFRNFEDGGELASALSLGFVRDHRDSVTRTTSGSRVALNTEIQGEWLGSYATMYKLSLSADKYWPVFRKSVFKLSGEIAALDSLSGDEPRIFDRYFSGGASSIRGFEERTVGPTDMDVYNTGADVGNMNDEAIGGQSLLLGSAELTTPIFKDTVHFAVFADAGNVWQDAYDWDVGQLNIGVGAGLRLFLPIGAVSIDYGFPIKREWDHLSKSGRVHFNLGYNF
jgi:outer membrane protein insertion porin family